MLHPLILFEEFIQLGLELRKVAFELFTGGVERFHGFEGDAGEGTASASLIVVVIEDTHLTAVSQIGLHLASYGGFSVDDL